LRPGSSCRDHDRLGEVAVLQQRGLDLAQLDPEPADLDLVVGPPEELQLPAGVHRTTSPVRYIRPPPAPNGHARNRWR
jgi:hypothetical protein